MLCMRAFVVIGAVLGWFALGLQLYLMLITTPSAWVATIITFFSFFTILTNILVALVFTPGPWAQFFRRPSVQAAVLVNITVVGAVYWLLLKHLWNPQGWQWVADTLLHTWQPLVYILYWVLFAPKAGLRWKDAAIWLAYPGVYLIYILGRGALTGVYPYPFVEVSQLGYARVAVNSGMLLVVFLGLGLLVVGLSRRLVRWE
jgi:hypothetical protein